MTSSLSFRKAIEASQSPDVARTKGAFCGKVHMGPYAVTLLIICQRFLAAKGS